MPNGYERRKYGQHSYPDRMTTNDCANGCGCWAGPSRSGGPLGLDPLHGLCPKNPLDGKPFRGNDDYEDVVNQRIEALELRAVRAEEALKAVEPDKMELAERLRKVEEKVSFYEHTIREFLRKIPGSII